ncbi:NADH-quinone oxidoreductase subunit NuoE [Kineosporia sp. J2-2]|uniref:NADH-quinone oxidoreductase subunit NuoE n=1 Tax=Kineosporia corallincola TaxID=2835133 RepID=A0ABS5T9M3_9ACTN|nr:NADH-quinone oxidoreductase subunit NuoE [Kineosporia corallincola]MBT0767772.1 NADH-quinone oxidoreductase subunit NuoE [Kineosporia corallincola]
MALSTEAVERLTAEAGQIIARYPQPRSALLPMLHLMQSEEGYVSPDGIALCAGLLGLSTAEVSAVATFYTQYKRHPNGEYTVGVCTNTLCAVMGGDAIFDSLEEHLGVGHDETTDDGKITLERIECNAACDFAPVMMVNWEFFDNQTPSSARGVCDRLRAGEPVAPSRGPNQVPTFKEVSHVLAGFNDGRANEGVAAGGPSLRGTLLAAEKGWAAPESEQGTTKTAAPVAEAAADVQARGAKTSGSDAPAVDPSTRERAGTQAGKPPGEATQGENDPGTGTETKG